MVPETCIQGDAQSALFNVGMRLLPPRSDTATPTTLIGRDAPSNISRSILPSKTWLIEWPCPPRVAECVSTTVEPDKLSVLAVSGTTRVFAAFYNGLRLFYFSVS